MLFVTISVGNCTARPCCHVRYHGFERPEIYTVLSAGQIWQVATCRIFSTKILSEEPSAIGAVNRSRPLQLLALKPTSWWLELHLACKCYVLLCCHDTPWGKWYIPHTVTAVQSAPSEDRNKGATPRSTTMVPVHTLPRPLVKDLCTPSVRTASLLKLFELVHESNITWNMVTLLYALDTKVPCSPT